MVEWESCAIQCITPSQLATSRKHITKNVRSGDLLADTVRDPAGGEHTIYRDAKGWHGFELTERECTLWFHGAKA